MTSFLTPVQAILAHSAKTPDKIFLRQPIDGKLVDFTWSQVEDQCRRIASSLHTLGMKKGDHIAILSKNCAEWVMADWAIQMAGMVSVRDTGIALKLQVRDLYQVPQSGQRTWLLRAGADLTLPWERHRTIEEGYLVSGDYRLFECLEGREKRFDYRAGGYFYRAPGIVHGGPSSGSSGEIVMLLRTPDKLTVEFLPTCSTTANP